MSCKPEIRAFFHLMSLIHHSTIRLSVLFRDGADYREAQRFISMTLMRQNSSLEATYWERVCRRTAMKERTGSRVHGLSGLDSLTMSSTFRLRRYFQYKLVSWELSSVCMWVVLYVLQEITDVNRVSELRKSPHSHTLMCSRKNKYEGESMTDLIFI